MRVVFPGAATDRTQGVRRIGASMVIILHRLRHTYALDLLHGDVTSGRRPATMMETNELWGHSPIITTQKYLDHLDSCERAGLALAIGPTGVGVQKGGSI